MLQDQRSKAMSHITAPPLTTTCPNPNPTTSGEFDGLTIADKRERIMGIAKELGLDRINIGERLAFAGPVIEVEAET